MAQELSEVVESPPAPRGGDFLRTDRLKEDLGARTARGGLLTVTAQGFKFAATMAATVVLARLLTPGDYGLVGMVAVVTGFIALFKDLGLSAATIQREEISQEQVSTLFWVNVGVSAAIGLLTAALAPVVAWFYGEPRLAPVTLAYSIGFLFGGLTVQHEALLKRQMRFAVLVTAEVAALLASIVTTVALAWRGFGYWSLVAGHLALSFVYMLAVWGVCGWRPGRPRRGAGVRSLLGFGGNLTGAAVVNYFARNLDNMLIGRFWGGWQLGLYAKAYQLL
ncbi:MAG TPA: lipopolysaccharide biosynthesis protein, partial [Pyrinomonadaceae bacterium]|nr:lipopolysaccharide biosynthesis protein [Pyrinomonadaceae bacterium]